MSTCEGRVKQKCATAKMISCVSFSEFHINTFGAGVWVHFPFKSHIERKLRTILQFHNLPVNYVRELSKPSQDSASLLVCNEKIFWGLQFCFCCGWRHKWGKFLAILALVTRPWVQPLDGGISLNFFLETSLKSDSVEPWISFLTFLFEELRPVYTTVK